VYTDFGKEKTFRSLGHVKVLAVDDDVRRALGAGVIEPSERAQRRKHRVAEVLDDQ
jgi:hypothetical protein